jgi:hypothetical protein
MVLRTAVMQEVSKRFKSFFIYLQKRSLSKHILCLPKNKEENLRLITEKDFDFIIRLLVISYLDSSWQSRQC